MGKRSKHKQEPIKLSFDTETVELPVERIVLLRPVTEGLKNSEKFRQVISSIREIGLIEPPVVTKDKNGRYILLDGHLRIEALKELGTLQVACLISTDDEAFTYNKHVNHLSPVQEHKMVQRAIERGVPMERIARALDMDVPSILRRKNLVEGICPEAVELLKDKMVAASVFPALKRMTAFRQIEAATLMRDAGIYSQSYAGALLAATPKDQLTDPGKPKRIRGLDETQMAHLEEEMQVLQREYLLIQESYGENFLNLTLAKTYLASLLGNRSVARYLSQHHPEIFTQFQKVADLTASHLREKETPKTDITASH